MFSIDLSDFLFEYNQKSDKSMFSIDLFEYNQKSDKSVENMS